MAEKFIDLKINSFKGVEHLNVLSMVYDATINTEYTIKLTCSYGGNDEIKTEELIGENAALTLSDANGLEKKHLHGVVTDVQQYNSSNPKDKFAFRNVKITIEPMLSLMDQHHNTRVFPSGNIISYVKSIAKDYQITKFTPPADCEDLIPREFCIQYNETDLNFIKRLLESEGIFYYFKHAEDGCTLKLGSGVADYDSSNQIKFGTGDDSIAYSSANRGNHVLPYIDVINDYDFNYPQKSLQSSSNKSTSKNVLNNSVVQNYTYPYPVRSFMDPTKNKSRTVGDYIAKRRLNSHRSRHEVIKLNIPGVWQEIDAGKRVNIEGKQGTFIITEYNLTIAADSAGIPVVRSTVTAIDTKKRFYPPLETPIPHIPSQTAVVIGSEDKTVYNKTADNADRNIFTKVKFHWDIDPKHTKDSNECSCWIRVAQPWAGSRRGFIFPPRAGDEVIVSFESGHPDVPLITGGAFNGTNTLPYSLKDNKNVSGIVSQTIGKGTKQDRSSAILFKDDAGQEEMSFLTKGQQVNVVGKDSLRQVDGSVTEHIKKDVNQTIDADSKTKIVGGESRDVGKAINIKSGDVINIESAKQICFKVGDNFITISKEGIIMVGSKIKKDDGGSPTPAEPAEPQKLPAQNPIV